MNFCRHGLPSSSDRVLPVNPEFEICKFINLSRSVQEAYEVYKERML